MLCLFSPVTLWAFHNFVRRRKCWSIIIIFGQPLRRRRSFGVRFERMLFSPYLAYLPPSWVSKAKDVTQENDGKASFHNHISIGVFSRAITPRGALCARVCSSSQWDAPKQLRQPIAEQVLRTHQWASVYEAKSCELTPRGLICKKDFSSFHVFCHLGDEPECQRSYQVTCGRNGPKQP